MSEAEEAGRSPETGGIMASRAFTSAGLELLKLEVSQPELAVIEAVDALYRPHVDALIRASFDGIEPEPGTDLSTGPHAVARR
jgi:hypothetical protein